MDLITDNYKFKNILLKFIKNTSNAQGQGGNFSPADIIQTRQEFQELFNFQQIPAPFHESIAHLISFHQEYRLSAKINLLVTFVDKVKEELEGYRTFYQMENAAFGSDQIMGIVNFITETSGKNIYAGTQYIKAILSGGGEYDKEKKDSELRDNLLELD